LRTAIFFSPKLSAAAPTAPTLSSSRAAKVKTTSSASIGWPSEKERPRRSSAR
jgi:hypothetical protein